VEVSQVPLYLSSGPSYLVWTESESTSTWFSNQLCSEPVDLSSPSKQPGPWSKTSYQSYTGILAEVPQVFGAASPAISEILFYGRLGKTNDQEKNIQLQVYALPLSSNRLHVLTGALTPPLSPTTQLNDRTGQFIVVEDDQSFSSFPRPEEPRVLDIWDSASDLRRKAKGRGGAGIAAAAAGQQINILVGQKKPKPKGPSSKNETKENNPGFDARPGTNSQLHSPFLSNHQRVRTIGRSPSLKFEGGQHDQKASTEHIINPSPLSRVTSFSAQEDNAVSTLEQQNKTTISRLVMAGMRLYGLQPKKKTESSQESLRITEIVTGTSTQDDEFKSIYHQTYKGVAFAFVRTCPYQFERQIVCLLS
jgi:Sld7 C-terminal domain